MPKTKPRKKKDKPADLPTMASVADKYVLYQLSVQEPEHEVEFFDRIYEQRHGRKPTILREDFCGTFAVCCEWVKLGADRRAVGVDLDPEPLDWGRAHNLSKVPEDRQQNIELRQDDVRTIDTSGGADILAAQNFSFWYFKTRAAVVDYFKVAHANLAEGGMMVIDMMGGGECYEEDHRDIRSIGGYDKAMKDRSDAPPMKFGKFKYIWEQHSYNPINHDASFFIHFKFKDGSMIERAFEYHWRFWTIAEVCELLREAGFSDAQIYWEQEDEDGDGNGEWEVVTDAASDPSWIAYIVGVR